MLFVSTIVLGSKMISQNFKPIPGYESFYEASSCGKIRSIRYNKILKVEKRINNNGYYSFCTCIDGIVKTHMVHRIIAETFLGPPNGRVVNHKDGDKKNNSIENLEWVTYSQNNIHAYKIGLLKPYDRCGDRNPNSKLSSENILEIIRLRKSGIAQKEIAAIFSIRQGHVSKILIKNGIRSKKSRGEKCNRLKSLNIASVCIS